MATSILSVCVKKPCNATLSTPLRSLSTNLSNIETNGELHLQAGFSFFKGGDLGSCGSIGCGLIRGLLVEWDTQ